MLPSKCLNSWIENLLLTRNYLIIMETNQGLFAAKNILWQRYSAMRMTLIAKLVCRPDRFTVPLHGKDILLRPLPWWHN